MLNLQNKVGLSGTDPSIQYSKSGLFAQFIGTSRTPRPIYMDFDFFVYLVCEL